MSPLDVALIVGAFALILVGAEWFTDGIEWLGIKLNLTEGATGSILAALGTATPETLIPIVAIVFTNTTQGDEIGVGAILGAPFMLATLVMLLIGVTAFAIRKRRGGAILKIDAPHARRDLEFFLVLYTIALGLALLPRELHPIKGVVGWVFLPAYFLYLYLVLRPHKPTPLELEEAKEEREAFEALTFGSYLERFGAAVKPTAPALWLVLFQTLFSFGMIVVGAEFFASFVEHVSTAMRFDALLVSLILAPLATELPEAANSLIWTRQGKDVIALGNVAGAMVFQSTIPVTIGVLLTPWELGSFGTVTAVFALASAALIYLNVRTRAKDNRLPASALMLGGSLYLIFLGYVIVSVVRP